MSESRVYSIEVINENLHLLESQKSLNSALSLSSLARECIKARKISQDGERPKQGKKWADVVVSMSYTS